MRWRMIRPVGRLPGDFLVDQLPHLLGRGDGGVVGFEANRSRLQFADQFGRIVQQRALGDDHPRALHFFARLLGVAAVGEEDAAAGEKQQQPVAAGVAAKVAQVRRMGDNEAVEVLLAISAARTFFSRERWSIESVVPRVVVSCLRNRLELGQFASYPASACWRGRMGWPLLR